MQGRDAHTVRLENNIGSRTVDVAGDVNHFAGQIIASVSTSNSLDSSQVQKNSP
ncbi:hypothetical protein J2W51_002313 [Tardiphaga robiniae]|nr:hypothetical protein [Tardiphaga robiniae]